MTLAKLAALLCQNPRFQAFIGVTSGDDAAMYVRRYCGVLSRAELDTNREAAARFHELRRSFAYREAQYA